MRRVLGFVLVAGLFVGGAAGCSSEGKASGDATTSAAEGASTADNAEVAAYCDAVDAYLVKVEAAQSDPGKAGELSSEAQKLSTKATALATADLSTSDVEQLGECTKRSAEALMPG